MAIRCAGLLPLHLMAPGCFIMGDSIASDFSTFYSELSFYNIRILTVLSQNHLCFEGRDAEISKFLISLGYHLARFPLEESLPDSMLHYEMMKQKNGK